jgi:hypothetical protein
MPEPTTSAADAAPAAVEDQPIRERVKELTSQVLQQGRVDPEAVRDVVSTVLGRAPSTTFVSGDKARELFADAVRQLDDALVKSASATHGALQQLASRGQDFTDNDLKEALASLRKLEKDYVAVANRLADVKSVRLTLKTLAWRRVASMMGEFASSMSAGSGLATMRGASAHVPMLASGVLARIADALRDHPERGIVHLPMARCADYHIYLADLYQGLQRNETFCDDQHRVVKVILGTIARLKCPLAGGLPMSTRFYVSSDEICVACSRVADMPTPKVAA